MRLYHCTTPKKLARYASTGCILPPVRGWSHVSSAQAWCMRTGRSIVLEIEVSISYPLPDHKPRGQAFWSPDMVRAWEVL